MSRLRLIPVAVLFLGVAGCKASDQANNERARQEVGVQATALMNAGNIVPADQKDFDAKTAVAGCPTDPWGNGYRYERLSIRKIRISSLGKDAKAGTPDDISEEFTFPSGSGLDSWMVTRADGTKAIKSPDAAHTFWYVQTREGDDQTTQWWIGDGKGEAAKPIKVEKLDGDWRRAVTLQRWTKDGKIAEVKDTVTPMRPDGSRTKEKKIYFDVASAKEADSAAVPPDESAWVEY